MSTPQVGGSTFGASVLRREDARFLTGRGRFTDDVTLPGTTHAAFVRSPHAHARIHAIDTTRAEATPGVRAVFTGAVLAGSGVNGIPVGWVLPDMKMAPQPPVAMMIASAGKVRTSMFRRSMAQMPRATRLLSSTADRNSQCSYLTTWPSDS